MTVPKRRESLFKESINANFAQSTKKDKGQQFIEILTKNNEGQVIPAKFNENSPMKMRNQNSSNSPVKTTSINVIPVTPGASPDHPRKSPRKDAARLSQG